MLCVKRCKAAFTLVELLVVIGIIALLIGILLPVLSKVRERGWELKCAANLHAIGQGLTVYVQDYRYYPGYVIPGGGRVLWPIRIRNVLGGNQDVFYCPARDATYQWRKYDSGTAPNPANATDALYGYRLGEERLTDSVMKFSYGYNAQGTGTSDNQPTQGLGDWVKILSGTVSQLNGELPAARVRKPSEMIAIADSAVKADSNSSCFVIHPVPEDLGPSPAKIHRGGANVLFCDGHVQWYPQQDVVGYNLLEYRLIKMWNNDQRPATDTY